MNRVVTNIIRIIMDEFFPPVIRDSYWFMYPFYYIGYRGKNLHEVMHYKSLAPHFTKEKYLQFYTNIDSVSRRRKTDLTENQLRLILKSIDNSTKYILDVGCGNGYLLQRVKKERPHIQVAGMDIVKKMQDDEIEFYKGNITAMPFSDGQFDTVICTHTIEHILDLKSAIKELERIAKKQLIIVTPSQRYFYYTLDEHINFFHKKEMVTSLFSYLKFTCKKINFDWVYVGNKDGL